MHGHQTTMTPQRLLINPTRHTLQMKSQDNLTVFSFFSRVFAGSVMPCEPIPLNLGGDNFTPKFRGRPPENTVKQGVSAAPPPKFRGEIVTPKIYGGMGSQGERESLVNLTFFLGKTEKSKERKDRVCSAITRRWNVRISMSR